MKKQDSQERIKQGLEYKIRDFKQDFDDKSTIEIMLNPDGRLFVEKIGQPMKYVCNIDAHTAKNIITDVSGFHGRVVTEKVPILECTFPLDNSRFTAQLPPIVANPTFTLRKKASAIFTLDDYVKNGIFTIKQKEIIMQMVAEAKNILVVGGTGTGKTTLVNGIIHEISEQFPHARLVTIEDTAELQVASENYVPFLTDVMSGITMTHLLKTTLRMRPDRILVGETRGPETLDLLMAWNTGHSGGVATLHADDAVSGLYKMVEYISMNPNAPKVIESLIGRAVDCVICIKRTKTGRKIDEILLVDKFDEQKNRFLTQSII